MLGFSVEGHGVKLLEANLNGNLVVQLEITKQFITAELDYCPKYTDLL